MKKCSRIIILTFTLALSIFIILGALFLMKDWGALILAALCSAGGVGALAGILFFIFKKDALAKTALVLLGCVTVVLVTVIILNYAAGLNDLDGNEKKIQALISIIEGAGGWSMAVYVLVQILQVVILPLPALVCYLPGTVIWGPLIATLLASLGVLIGAVICYFLGRLFGRRVVEWIAGKEACAKYADYLGKRGKVLFVMMQILPFFPDDILCLVAGLTKMNFPFFLVTMILVRPAIVATYCYFGSGEIIPFSGWGIPVWIAILAACIVIAVLSFRYQERIEAWLKKVFTKNKD